MGKHRGNTLKPQNRVKSTTPRYSHQTLPGQNGGTADNADNNANNPRSSIQTSPRQTSGTAHTTDNNANNTLSRNQTSPGQNGGTAHTTGNNANNTLSRNQTSPGQNGGTVDSSDQTPSTQTRGPPGKHDNLESNTGSGAHVSSAQNDELTRLKGMIPYLMSTFNS